MKSNKKNTFVRILRNFMFYIVQKCMYCLLRVYWAVVSRREILHTSTNIPYKSAESTHKLVIIVAGGLKSLPFYFEELWHAADLRICADGGSNNLHDFNQKEELYIPDLIVGDLDSIHKDVLAYFEQKGVLLRKLVEQDTNDLNKCLRVLVSYCKEHSNWSKPNVSIVGGLGGRFDHEMANISCAIRYQYDFNSITLLSEISSGTVFAPGIHRFVRHSKRDGKVCGLIPIGGRVCVVRTDGLKWDLGDCSLEFGELISTSNEITRSEVIVENSGSLIWTVEFR